MAVAVYIERGRCSKNIYKKLRILIRNRRVTDRAELTIVPTDNHWKLTALQLLDEERLI